MKKNINYLWAIAVVVPALWGCTQIPGDLGRLNYNQVKQAMVLIKGGTFQMGQTGVVNATPVHQVTVSSFFIDNTDVTQADYQAVMGVNPSYYADDSLMPVVSESWNDAVLYCNARSKLKGLDTVYFFTAIWCGPGNTPGSGCDSLSNLVIDYSKNGYRLPTEAEWEYACRAGSTTRSYWGDAMDLNYCLDSTNSGHTPHRVGQKVPNDFGLYDMNGNVLQWCNDWYAVYPSISQTDPTGPPTGTLRILRGGSWASRDNFVNSACRWKDSSGSRFSDAGFRCVLAGAVLPPLLSSPASGATGQSQPLMLSWSPVSNAIGYYVQVSTDSFFTTVVFEDTALIATSTSRTVSGLSGGVTYYWRVMAANASERSDWSAVLSFTTAAVSLQAPTLLSPMSTATNQPLVLALSWSTVVNATGYHVQVSTSSTFTTIFSQDSTLTSASKTISNLAGGVTYYWRVRAKNSGGVSTWTTPWNFTTIVTAIPSAPSLVTPLNGSTNQSITPTLVWSAVSGATTYYVQVSSNPAFTGIISQDSTLTVDSMKLGALSASTPYYWHVRAKNAAGVSAWTSMWTFTTGTPALQTPALNSPANGTTGLSYVRLMLTWSTVSNAASYRVQVSLDSSFTNVFLDDSTLTSASKTSDSFPPIVFKYFWRVRAKNAAGVSAWTTPWSFTTSSVAIQAPLLNSPANGMTMVNPMGLTLSWSTVGTAILYRLQVSSDSSFTTVTVEDSTLVSLSKTLDSLSRGIKYFWRVRARSIGGVSSWTPPWSFTTAPSSVPAVPALVSPVNGAPGQPQVLTLVWSPVTGALWYRVQLSTSSTFATVAVDDSTLTAASRSVGTLAPGTTYYWRVRAKSAAGAVSAWTSPWNFATSTAPLPSPVLNSPANGATMVDPVGLQLNWSAVTNATSYRVRVSPDSTFATAAVDDSTLTSPFKTLDSLPRGVKYFWRVRAKNAAGMSVWTSPWNFTTVPPPILSVPTLISPASGSVNQSQRPTLVWSPVSGAATYHVQVSTDTNFSFVVIADSTLVTPSKTIDSLPAGVKVFWRVRAKNAAGTSGWTTPWTFTTIMPSIPSVPSLVSPATGSSNQSRRPTVSWSSVGGATSYHVQVSANPGFTAVIAVDSTLTVPFKSLDSALSTGILYFWRVRAKNAAGVSAWTSAWSFTVTTTAGPWIARAGLPAAIIYMGVAVVNNKIYAFGGYDGSSYTNGVYLYDPAGDAWTAYGTMTAARAPAAAEVNGRIYVIGGGDIGTVEEYDPVARTFTPKASMPTVRGPAVAVVGSLIYAVGGYNSITGSLGTNESYNPSSDTWTRLANMTPRNSTPVAAAGGKVYAFGGEYLPNTPYSLVQEYDPSGNAWVTKTALPSARTRAAAATVNGKIYVIGGTNDVIDLAEVELYDPSSDKWTAKTAMPTARSGSAIAVVNGKIYVIGGSNIGNPRLTTVEEYDPLLDP